MSKRPTSHFLDMLGIEKGSIGIVQITDKPLQIPPSECHTSQSTTNTIHFTSILLVSHTRRQFQGQNNTFFKLYRLPCKLDDVRSMALDAFFLTKRDCQSLADDLHNCSNLKDLTLVSGQPYRVLPTSKKLKKCLIVKSRGCLSVTRLSLHNQVNAIGTRTFVSWDVVTQPEVKSSNYHEVL